MIETDCVVLSPSAAEILDALGRGVVRRVVLRASSIAGYAAITECDASNAWQLVFSAVDRQDRLSVCSLAQDYWQPCSITIENGALSRLSCGRRAFEVMARKAAEDVARSRGAQVVAGLDIVVGWQRALEKTANMDDLDIVIGTLGTEAAFACTR